MAGLDVCTVVVLVGMGVRVLRKRALVRSTPASPLAHACALHVTGCLTQVFLTLSICWPLKQVILRGDFTQGSLVHYWNGGALLAECLVPLPQMCGQSNVQLS